MDLLRASLRSPERLHERWRALARPPWLEDTATRHGLGAYLLSALARLDPKLVPAASAARARGILRQRWQEACLAELDASLAEAGLSGALLKGPPLADALYGAGLRTSLDLDVLVDPADLEAALDAIGQRGFRAEQGPQARYARARHHHLHLRREGAPLVELHFKALTGFGAELPARPLLACAAPLPGCAALKRLGPAHELCYLGVHAAGHLFERALWLFDLALLSRAGATPWAEAAACAAEHGLAAPFAFSALRLRQDLGLFSPGQPELAPARAQLAARLLPIDRRLPPGGPAQVALRLAFQACLAHHPATSARFLVRHAGRIGRRRLQRRFPGVTPDDWAG